MAPSDRLGPLELEAVVDQVRAVVPGARLATKLTASCPVEDPRAIARVLRDLLQGAAAQGRRMTVGTRDRLREGRQGAERWLEVLLFEPPGGPQETTTNLLLAARARLAGALLMGGARPPILDYACTPTGTLLRILFPEATPRAAGLRRSG
jgi:hypothetical protein